MSIIHLFETIAKLVLTNHNYKKAIDILQDRYANPEVLISAYMDNLVKLPQVKSMNNLTVLRKLMINLNPVFIGT